MGDQNQDRLQQQQNDTQRPQAGQQNQQGENRQPPQQRDDRQQAQPGQQNQQADRNRRSNDGVDGADQNGLKDGGSARDDDQRRDRTDDVDAQR